MNKAFTLISTLVTLALILILAIVFMTGGFGGYESNRKDKLGKTIPGTVMLAAKDTKCREYLSQCRQGALVSMTSSEDEQPPSSLAELKLGSELTHCPVGKEAYIYDPAAYAVDKDLIKLVRCPHLGHEKY